VKTALASLAAATLVAGCATNTITGRSQLMLVSEEHAISGSASAYNQMMGGFTRKKQIETGTPRAEKVREITDKLIAQAVRFRPDSASWKWEVQVINDPKTVNAFCMAGGKMAIYTGFWEKLKATDDEVAAVMGHEIGHALASHTRERMSVAYSTSIGTTLAAIALGARSDTASLMQQAAIVGVQLPNSRESETEADQIGIELAARAGYDPKAAVTLWEKMGKLGGNPPEFLSTHPSPANRAAALKELAVKVEPYYLAVKSGKTVTEAPSFLNTREGANERTVTKVGEMTREQYAARAATEADTMTFRSVPFEQFRTGVADFKCRAECFFSYGRKKGDWAQLHSQKKWRDLALAVMDVGYLSDLSYFMLGEAATGLGLKDAAKVYYGKAREAGKEFACGGPLNSCEGFDVQKQASAALSR
jgi:predicted Zn-dependent protease